MVTSAYLNNKKKNCSKKTYVLFDRFLFFFYFQQNLFAYFFVKDIGNERLASEYNFTDVLSINVSLCSYVQILLGFVENFFQFFHKKKFEIIHRPICTQ